MRARCSAGMPTPVSATSMTASCPSMRVTTESHPPLGIAVARVEEEIEEDLLNLVFDPADDQRRRLQLFTHLNGLIRS